MALRKYTNPRDLDLSPGLQDVLRRNGMQAHMSMLPNGQMQLIVLGHDSPAITYNLNSNQVESLMAWGSNYANKKAYNTFTSIVKNDFYMPDNFVSARNAFGRVAMGLHGYRIGAGEYGIPYYRPFNCYGRGWRGDFVGWSPGYHMRRIGNQPFMVGGGIMTPVRPDGRMKPGELRSGGYGFYYKGQQQQTQQSVLDNILVDDRIKPLEAAPRPEGKAIPYSEVIWEGATNGFTNEKFQEVLKSHGIIVDAEKKTLTIQSAQSPLDMMYDLTEEELKTLTNPGIGYPNGKTVEERLAVINNKIMVDHPDFANPITMEMLESKNLVSLDLTEEAKKLPQIAAFYEQQARYEEQQRLLQESNEVQKIQEERANRIAADPKAIDGLAIREILGNKGWYQPVNNGREMVVGEISVDNMGELNAFIENDKFTDLNENFSFENFRQHVSDEAFYGEARRMHEDQEHHYLKIDEEGNCKCKFTFLDDKERIFEWKLSEEELAQLNTKGLKNLSFEQRMTIVRESFVKAAEYDDKIFTEELMQKYPKLENVRTDVAGAFFKSNIQRPTVKDFQEYMKPTSDEEKEELQDKYIMSAVINGETVVHEISKKEYDKFLALDDAHRLKLFDSIFKEVAIKNSKGESQYDKMFLDRNGNVMVHDGYNADFTKTNYVNGENLQQLKEHKGFYRDIKHGREVEVGEIRVDKEEDGKYKMTAVLDGKSVTHEITQKQYDKFLAVDDYQRMKLFSKIFDEVDIKTRPGEGTNIGAAILAALVVTGEVLADPMMRRGPEPEIYKSRMPGTTYYKPGVVSPAEVAAANYESLDRPNGRDYNESRGMGM